ncbi:uncharacterized protein LOC123829490 isoform X1 [Phyllostomus hastatus]|uniref:uncharacterized protein LOC123829490 isoform X1 n=1 Tax=Phyllostomus hastatus TaxID=9423 RepID=UPI001E6851E4|nr:uncharacterized protein LOC123829490 isoform X1 [Phyllostomus hastatus]
MNEHWAIYVGGGHVVHLVCEGQYSRPHSSNNSEHEVKAVVKYELLKDVANNDSYKVNNYLDRRYRPHPVKLAKENIGEIRCCSVLQPNCEHFVTELRNGQSYSQQGPPPRTGRGTRGSSESDLLGHSPLLPGRRLCERVHAALKAVTAPYDSVPENQGVTPRKLLWSATLDRRVAVLSPRERMYHLGSEPENTDATPCNQVWVACPQAPQRARPNKAAAPLLLERSVALGRVHVRKRASCGRLGPLLGLLNDLEEGDSEAW